MELKGLTNVNLISVNINISSKEEAIKYLIDKLYKEGKISSAEKFYDVVMEREAHSPTGIDEGLAVPHGKSNIVKEASFAVAIVKDPIEDWESIVETNKVKFIFLLAIPDDKDSVNNTHMQLLAELSKRISDENYVKFLANCKTPAELYSKIDDFSKEKEEVKINKDAKTFVAVTACPAGIAHTYMAAEALEKAARKAGINIFVEKQGANGIEDKISDATLKTADAAIFATDVAVKNSERFQHLPIVKTTVASPLKDADGIIQKAIIASKEGKKSDFISSNSSSESNDDEKLAVIIKQSVLTGISNIIPIIVAGGMILAFATLVAQGFKLQEVYNAENSWLWLIRKLGGNMLGTLMIPVLSAYMAFSIADKPALGPGFAAGVASNLINGGFLGGMIGGLFAGFFLKFLKKNFPSKGTFAGFISFWVYPVVGSLITGIFMLLIIGKPVAALNNGLIAWLDSLSGVSSLLLGAVIGIFVSFDLGGPINKAAYTFCIGAMANGNLVPYATFASVKMVSAFAVTASTTFFKKYYEEYEIEIGKSTWLLGLAGITEGAIPFMIKDPLRVIPSLCAGSAITGAIVAYFNIGLDVPGAGIFSLFMLKSSQSSFTAAFIWFFAAVIGAAISTFCLVITRKQKLQSNK